MDKRAGEGNPRSGAELWAGRRIREERGKSHRFVAARFETMAGTGRRTISTDDEWKNHRGKRGRSAEDLGRSDRRWSRALFPGRLPPAQLKLRYETAGAAYEGPGMAAAPALADLDEIFAYIAKGQSRRPAGRGVFPPRF